jgi:hypothetical protein
MCGTRASAGKRRTVPSIQSQAARFGRFFAALEQRLQAQADAQKRHPGADAFDQCVAHLHLVERPHHLAEVAHAGQDDLRRASRNPAASRTSVYRAPISASVFSTERRFPAP